MRFDASTDGHLQVLAGVALLERSALVEWKADVPSFHPVAREAFESSWRRVDPVFGRLICWMAFSAGAEFLAKGVCLVNGVEIRDEKRVPGYPMADIGTWPTRFRAKPGSDGMMTVTTFGTLRNLTQDDPPQGTKAALGRLCEAAHANPAQRDLLLASYQLLQRSIRNRDAHAYVPNVRDAHYNLVPTIFSKCFDLLVSWLPAGAATLNKWRAHADRFVESL